MITRLFILLACLMLLGGCSPYPRYGVRGGVTPREMKPTEQRLTVDQELELGMLLQDYLGRPYRFGGSGDDGIDCSEFVRVVFREFLRKEFPRTAAEQFTRGIPVPGNRLYYGDLVFFETEPDTVTHVGVYVGYNEFIHATSSKGVIINRLDEEYWAQRYVGARRIIEEPGRDESEEEGD